MMVEFNDALLCQLTAVGLIIDNYLLDPVSISDKTSYYEISLSVEPARF